MSIPSCHPDGQNIATCRRGTPLGGFSSVLERLFNGPCVTRLSCHEIGGFRSTGMRPPLLEQACLSTSRAGLGKGHQALFIECTARAPPQPPSPPSAPGTLARVFITGSAWLRGLFTRAGSDRRRLRLQIHERT